MQMDSLFMQPKVHQYGSHMVMTNVTRTRKTKLISIDTRFRENITQVTSMGNIQITLSERINNVHSMWVESLELPFVMENFSAAIGNTSFWVTLKDNTLNPSVTTVKEIIIPDGQYTSLQNLVTAIDTAVGAALGNNKLHVHVDGSTGKPAFYTHNNYEATIRFDDGTAGGCQGIGQQFLKRSLGWFLGFREYSYTLGESSQVIAESVLDMFGLRYVYLVVQEFSKNAALSSFLCPMTSSSMLSKQVLAKIPLHTVSFGDLLVANSYNGSLVTDRRQYNGPIDVQKLHVQLVDALGQPVDLKGFDFSFCIAVEYE